MFMEQKSLSRTGFIDIKQGNSHNPNLGNSHNPIMWDTKALDMADKNGIFNMINGVDGYIQEECPYKSICYNLHCQFIF